MKASFKLLVTIPFLCSTAFADSALKVSKSGRAPSANLKVKSSLVPTFEVYQKKVVNGKTEIFKVKNIPALDLGEERQVVAADLSPLRLPAPRDVQAKETRRRESPAVLQFQLLPYNDVVSPSKNLTSTDAFKKIPDVKLLNPIMDPRTTDPLVQLTKMDEMQPNDYKLLQTMSWRWVFSPN